MVASINAGTADNIALMSQIKKTLLKNFADSFDKTDKNAEKKINEQIKSLISSADKDNNGTLSKDELSSIDTKDNPDLAKTVNSLINGFDSYDTNHDNELSADELKDAFKKLNKEFSQQDVAKMAKEMEEFRNSQAFAVSTSNFSSALSEKIINNYGNSSSFSLSSLGLDL